MQWLKETGHKRTHDEDRRKLNRIGQFWRGRLLSSIDRDDVQYLAGIFGQTAKPSTVNRYLALIRAIFNRACKEWEWLIKAPFVRLWPESRRRVRWLTTEQVFPLLEQLPPHQRAAATFGLATGLRHANVIGLRWDQIDLRRRVAWFYADQVKNGEDLHVSLNDAALQILQEQRGKHKTHVFVYKGEPIKRLSTPAWHKALKRAGIEDFRWHDLRHTWASWLVQNGVPLYAVQEMGGWKTASMVRRYAHMAPAVNLEHAKKIDAMLRP